MMEIEQGGADGDRKIPKAARQVYAIMGDENIDRFRTKNPQFKE